MYYINKPKETIIIEPIDILLLRKTLNENKYKYAKNNCQDIKPIEQPFLRDVIKIAGIKSNELAYHHIIHLSKIRSLAKNATIEEIQAYVNEDHIQHLILKHFTICGNCQGDERNKTIYFDVNRKLYKTDTGKLLNQAVLWNPHNITLDPSTKIELPDFNQYIKLPQPNKLNKWEYLKTIRKDMKLLLRANIIDSLNEYYEFIKDASHVY